MLPGFRFLFAAIMLSMSFLVFGLGAAALLRAAHESFASNSSWRGAAEVAFAQPPETTLPMLATLRVEPVTEKPASAEGDQSSIAAPAEAPSAAPATRPEPASAAAEPAKADQIAAATPVEAPVEAVKPNPNNALVDTPASMPVDLAVMQNPPAPEVAPAAPVVAEPAVPAKETETAAVETSSASEPIVVQPVPAAPPPASPTPVAATPTPAATAVAAASAEPAASAAPATPVTPEAAAEISEAETKIATLGGPPVEIDDSGSVLPTRAVKLPRARPDESLIKKRQEARRARRRRLAARARLLAQQQLQANPFAQQPLAQPQQPYLQPAATTRQRQ